MLYREHAQKRLRAFCAQISELLGSEFPYPQSKEALRYLHRVFGQKLAFLSQRVAFLESVDANTNPEDYEQLVDLVKKRCIDAVTSTFDYLPILGFLLRSTNVRNAFEAYWPLRRLARAVLEPGIDEKKRATELILSSEWDYSPLVYSNIGHLKDFVLIGLPAPESENPLLLPLAGTSWVTPFG